MSSIEYAQTTVVSLLQNQRKKHAVDMSETFLTFVPKMYSFLEHVTNLEILEI